MGEGVAPGGQGRLQVTLASGPDGTARWAPPTRMPSAVRLAQAVPIHVGCQLLGVTRGRQPPPSLPLLTVGDISRPMAASRHLAQTRPLNLRTQGHARPHTGTCPVPHSCWVGTALALSCPARGWHLCAVGPGSWQWKLKPQSVEGTEEASDTRGTRRPPSGDLAALALPSEGPSSAQGCPQPAPHAPCLPPAPPRCAGDRGPGLPGMGVGSRDSVLSGLGAILPPPPPRL